MTKNAFFSEFFSIPVRRHKNTSYHRLHVGMTQSLDEISEEKLQMLKKIINLFPNESSEFSSSLVTDTLDVSELLQTVEVEYILFFVDKKLVKSLHFKHDYKGFQKINQKHVIFIPSINEFAENQKAKKYLWKSIQELNQS